ncbi:MAG: hypothetical protein K8I60_14645 [Anaerolineae bacterium]|nr:hypothetical protein [Anaerolineae bacterium]
MSREMLYGFLRIGVLVGGCGFLLIFLEPPGSTEFILSVCSALIGGFLVTGVVLISRWLRE